MAEELLLGREGKVLEHFFELSGFHPILPLLEMKSILTSEKSSYKVVQETPQCLIVTCSTQLAYKSAKRAAHCRRAVKLLHQGEINQKNYHTIAKEISATVDFTQIIAATESFLVRVYRVAEAAKSLISTPLEEAIGKEIWTQMQGKSKANMKQPDITFSLLFLDGKYLFGQEIYSKGKNYFASRRPDIRPFFKPGTLEPRFACLMVNLSQANDTSYFLDPFCGPGGILIEGALMECNVVGMDIDKHMVEGARKNLRYYSPLENYELLIGDIKALPFERSIHAIATDPPYGRASSSHGKGIPLLLAQLFEHAHAALVNNGRLAVGMSSEVPLEIIAEEHGFQREILENIYIHKSLTRRIGVFRKK